MFKPSFPSWLGLVPLFLLSFMLPATGSAVVDNTTCSVLSDSDSTEDFHSLRRKVEEGFNRPDNRMCTELIQFGDGKEYVVRLQDTLILRSDTDLDCPAGPDKPAVCGDSWGLILDGSTSPSVTLDASALPPGTCALRLQASRVLVRGIKIKVQRREDAICDEGNYNDVTGVQVESGNPVPTPEPTPQPPTPSPTPPPSPSPTPTPLATPTPTPSVTPTPTPGATPTPSPEPTPTPTPTATPDPEDEDLDEVPNASDNCPTLANSDQADADTDGLGDACDEDFSVSPGDDDGDGLLNEDDNCENAPNPLQGDADLDGLGDACDTEMAVNVPERFPGMKHPSTSCMLRPGGSESEALMWILLSLLAALGLRPCRKS